MGRGTLRRTIIGLRNTPSCSTMGTAKPKDLPRITSIGLQYPTLNNINPLEQFLFVTSSCPVYDTRNEVRKG